MCLVISQPSDLPSADQQERLVCCDTEEPAECGHQRRGVVMYTGAGTKRQLDFFGCGQAHVILVK